MKKITMFFVALFCFSLGFGQGFETFENANLTTNYEDGSFVGNGGITWTYVHSRDEGDYAINDEGIMLRRASEPSSLSATIEGGIGNFSVDTRKAFTGNSDRILELYINDVLIETFEPAFGSGADDTVIPFVVENINVEGEFDLEIRVGGSGTTGRQIILDNITWTSYTAGGGDPDCDDIGIITTVDDSVCDSGSMTLEVTASSDNVYWYDAEVDGNLVGSGLTFNTPVLTETTSYWASEYILGDGSVSLTGQGKEEPFPTSTGTTPGASGWGLIFTADEAFIIEDVEVFITGTSAGSLTVELTDMSQNVIATTTVATPAGSSSEPEPFTVPLMFDVQPGQYRLVAMPGGPAMIRDFSPAFPYALGTVGEINTGALGTGTNNAYYFFYNWTISIPEIECESERTEVIATVNETIAIEASSSEDSICEGESVELSVTSANSDYEYTWEPGGLTGANVTVNPDISTTYTVTAIDPNTGCTTEDSVSVTVTVVPNELTITPDEAEICAGTTIALTAGGAGGGDIVHDFEEGSEGWTIINNSSNANADWTLVQSPFQTSLTGAPGLLSSNDESQFFLSDANALGSGGSVDAMLISPSFSLAGSTDASISFYHYYRLGSTTTTSSFYTEARVEVSIDGGENYSLLEQYDTVNQGAPLAFAFETLSLNNYLGESDVRVRFHYDGGWGYFWAIDNVVIEGASAGLTTWTPTTDLYLDEDATIPYDGSAVAMVYMNGSAAGDYTYTATLTVGTCGSVSADVTISVIDSPEAPEGEEEQFFTEGETLADLDVTGTNLTWYEDENGTIEIPETTLLVDETTYYVSQSAGDCESELLAITVFIELSVNDDIFNGFTYYPNPVENILHLNANNTIESAVIYNALGQVVLQQNIKSTQAQLNTDSLSSGVYFMQISAEGKTAVYRLIKK